MASYFSFFAENFLRIFKKILPLTASGNCVSSSIFISCIFSYNKHFLNKANVANETMA
jgi:hypothetical protein